MIEPVRAPAADGVKPTVTVHDAPGATLAPEVHVLLVTPNSALVAVVVAMTSGAVPVLVSVKLCAVAALPTVAVANASAALDKVAAGAVTTTAAPVPLREMTLVAGDALWLIVTEPERAPAADGVKLMLSMHVALGAMLALAEQVLLVMLNSVPVTVDAPSTKASVPVLVSVTICAAAVAPRVVEAKLKAVLDNDADGAPTTTATPVPDKDTVLVAGEAL